MIRGIIGLLVMGMGLLAQQPTAPTSIALAETGLPAVTQISPIYSGPAPSGGNSQNFCYWIVTRFGVGNGPVSNPACVNVNPVGGSVVVNWVAPNIGNQNAPKYTLTYDVLRTVGANMPSPCTGCVLASATSANTATDTLATLASGYTFVTYNPGVVNFSIDNTSTDRAIAYNVTQAQNKRQADIRHGNTLPTYCNVGDLFILDTTQVGNICGNSNNWVSFTAGSVGPCSIGIIAVFTASNVLGCAGNAAATGSITAGLNSLLSGSLDQTSSSTAVGHLSSSDSMVTGVTLNYRLDGTGAVRQIADYPQLLVPVTGTATCGGQWITWAVGGDTVVNGTVKYYSPGQSLGGTTQLNRVWMVNGPVGATGTVKVGCLSIAISGTQPANPLTCVLLDNGSAFSPSITLSVPGGSVFSNGNPATYFFQDVTHFGYVNIGDLLSIQCTQTVTGTSSPIASLGVMQQ